MGLKTLLLQSNGSFFRGVLGWYGMASEIIIRIVLYDSLIRIVKIVCVCVLLLSI